MPLNKKLKKILVIGSGPIIIGQAAEFDYAGTQACKAIKEEGIEVILLNSNPATIMTDTDIADRFIWNPSPLKACEDPGAGNRRDLSQSGRSGRLNMALAPG